jgi:Tfp pilus assembly protein PilN
MLGTNLSTRPFYNERAVHALLALAGLVVLVLTIFNVYEIAVLSKEQSDLGNRASVSETRARELRAHATQVRQGLDPKQLEAISGEAREANAIIGQRLFSWTDLLNRLETTLPEEVRITAMRPRVERDGRITIQMNINGRRFEDINQFLENLEATGAFTDMLPRDEITNEDGLHLATIEGHYLPSAAPAPAKGAR